MFDHLLRRYGGPYLAAMSPAQRREVQVTHEAIHRAALQWREEMGAPAGRGSSETSEPEAARESAREVTTTEAALMLGVSERRVRQLAAGWAEGSLARKSGGRWLIHGGAVDLHRQIERGT